MNGRNRSSQSLSTSAECTPAASAHTQSRRSCASWAATLGWVEAGRLGASSWLQALGSPRPRRARETVTRRERPPRQSAVAAQARGGWAAQGVKKRCRLPPVVDGLSALPQLQLDLGGVFPARSARSPASPTRVAVEYRSGAIPRAPRPRAGGGGGPGAGDCPSATAKRATKGESRRCLRSRASTTTPPFQHPRPSSGVAPPRGLGPALAPSPGALCLADSTPRGVAFQQASYDRATTGSFTRHRAPGTEIATGWVNPAPRAHAAVPGQPLLGSGITDPFVIVRRGPGYNGTTRRSGAATAALHIGVVGNYGEIRALAGQAILD